MSEATQDIAALKAESDRPNNRLIFGIVAATLVTLVALVAGVNELFKATMNEEISTKVLEPPSTPLRSLRATEQQKLTRYQWVSEKDGIVRIPLDRAVELTLQDYRAGRAARPAEATKPAPEGAAKQAPEGAAKQAPEGAEKR